MLNDVYSEDELPDFRLGARPRVPHREPAPAAAASQDDEPTETVVPPTASAVLEDRFQQLLDRLDALSQQQQQQLQSDFVTFREQISDQQMELLAGQCRILGYFRYDSNSSSSQPPF